MSHTKTTSARYAGLRTIMGIAATGVLLVACAPGDILDVSDPDIINPPDVASAAGAEGLRIGALARLTSATSGDESMFLLGGLFADEWNNGDTFIARQEIDQRITTLENNFLLAATRTLHRARISGEQAIAALREFNPDAPAHQIPEMYFVQAYVENLIAEHFCSGMPFSTVVDGVEPVYGEPLTTTEVLERALAHADSGLAALPTTATGADADRARYALQVTKGRILLNLNRPAEAAAAVAGVPTTFEYLIAHSPTAQENQIWLLNNSARRYSVSNAEAGEGLNFATANDPRLPVCQGGSTACRDAGTTQTRRDDNTTVTLYVQLKWPTRGSPVAIVTGVEARLIEAEAALGAGNYAGANGTLPILNTLRTTVTGLAPLTDPGTAAARVDQLFRERAFWMFSTGHRTGDLRRLIRQYGRDAGTVFPSGAWHKQGNYGTDVNLPVPDAERNNENAPQGSAPTCIDRNA